MHVTGSSCLNFQPIINKERRALVQVRQVGIESEVALEEKVTGSMIDMPCRGGSRIFRGGWPNPKNGGPYGPQFSLDKFVPVRVGVPRCRPSWGIHFPGYRPPPPRDIPLYQIVFLLRVNSMWAVSVFALEKYFTFVCLSVCLVIAKPQTLPLPIPL